MAGSFEIDIHIGKMIKAEFQRSGRRIQWLAEQLNCNRSNVYSIFSRRNIDIKTLIKLSVILDHNFLKDLAALTDNFISITV